MKLTVADGHVLADGGRIKATHSVLQAVQVANRVYVIYDYMEFPRKLPARNLFAYDLSGNELWRAPDIGCGPLDAYTNFVSERPLTVFNFACYICVIDEANGQVVSSNFTK
jgi:hypothetical protein